MYARGEQYYVSAMRNTMRFTKFPAIDTSVACHEDGTSVS